MKFCRIYFVVISVILLSHASSAIAQSIVTHRTVATPVRLQKHVDLMTPAEIEESKKYGTILLKPAEKAAIEAEWAVNRAKALLPREPSVREIELEAMRFKLTPNEKSAARLRLMAE